MRSLIVFASVFSALPLALVFPFVGVLLWAFIAFMSPEREAFGIATDFTFNYYVALTTLLAWAFSTEPKRLPNQMLTILIIVLTVLFSITTYAAIDFPNAYELWDRHIRTIALVLTVLSLASSKLRIQAFIWVVVLSIGYYAVKGGAYFLLTAGSGGAPVFGPEDTMIDDNNHLALAILTTIPLLYYLRTTSSNQQVKTVCLVAIGLSVMAVVGTYSRGGFVGLVVVGIAFLMIARRRMAAILMATTLALGIMSVAPPDWIARIGSIKSFRQDDSSVSRLAAWETSWNLALDRPLVGGGFSAIETPSTYVKYRARNDQTEADGRAAHSIYFQLLGDHGFPAFLVYMAMLAAGMYNLVRVQTMTSGRPELAWANLLSRMLSVSFAGYLTAGAFLSMAYYDVWLCLIALTGALREVVMRAPVRESDPVVDDLIGDGVPARAIPAFRSKQ